MSFSFSAPTVILQDAQLPEGWIFPHPIKPLGIGARVRPTFGPTEVAKVFFGRGDSWLRINERKALLDGVPLEKLLPPRPPGDKREYTLYDIERMAHAFAASGIITGERLRIALRLLQLEAHLWRYVMEGSQ